MTELRPAAAVARAPATVSAEQLVLHAPVMLALARSIVRSDSEAQDLVQATFEIALVQRTALRDPGALRAWLSTILVREAFRVTRRLRRLVSLDGLRVHRETAGEDTPEASHFDLRDALVALPTRMRTAVALHHLVGLSVHETAGAMGVSDNTVKTLLRLGLARLRAELSS